MLRFLTNRIPVFVIITVTGLAFFAGYIQNTYSTQSDDNRKIADTHQLNTQRIEDRKRDLSDIDRAYFNEMVNYYTDALNSADKYFTFYNNLTDLERSELKLDFLLAIDSGLSAMEFMPTWDIHNQFLTNPNLQTYVISSHNEVGYDYNITRDQWKQYTPFYNITKNEFFLEFVPILALVNDYPTLVNDLVNFYDSSKGVYNYIAFDGDNEVTLLSVPLWTEQQLELYYRNLENSLSYKGGLVTMGVSVTTVSTVLATAMATRIDNKNSGRRMESLTKDILDRNDLIGILGLLLSLIVAVVGLIIPIMIILGR